MRLDTAPRGPWLLLAACLLALGPLARPTDARQRDRAPEPPSFLFVVIDDASWDEFEQLELPTMQVGSTVGRVYERFYTSTLCSPSRAQLHFGRLPHRDLIGAAINPQTGSGVPTETTSLAEALAYHGYATGMFGKWHVNGKELPARSEELARIHGYQVWRAGAPGNLTGTFDHYNWPRIDDGQKSTESTYTTHAVGDALVDWWNATTGPKFASLCFFAPHEPFQLAPLELLAGQTFEDSARGRYESALVAIDTKLAQIAGQLDLSETYVFLLPDNGTPSGVAPPNSNEQGFKESPFEGGINVPLVVWGPDVQPGTDSSLTQIVDLPATVLDLAGIASPTAPFLDSTSFAPSLIGGGPTTRTWAFASRFTPNGPAPALNFHEWAVVRDDGYKLIRNKDGVLRLYDLNVAPYETFQVFDPVVQNELLLLQQSILGPDWPY